MKKMKKKGKKNGLTKAEEDMPRAKDLYLFPYIGLILFPYTYMICQGAGRHERYVQPHCGTLAKSVARGGEGGEALSYACGNARIQHDKPKRE
jgi:hypothetical protein